MSDPIYVTKSFEQITPITSAAGTGLTDANWQAEGVVYALVQCNAATCRYRTDGTAPTNAIGHYIAQYGAVEVWGLRDMGNFLAIEATSTAILDVTYFGTGG